MDTDKIYFLFGVHNHQPVGNFEHVFEEAYRKAYRPFLEAVAQRPWFRFCLHNSGCLWEWLEEHHPEYLDLVKEMVDRGQIELWGGGFYEPVLPAIPERDRQGQLALMSDYLYRRFRRRPVGAWVAERVWEPSLPATLSRAGIGYTVLDDAHFQWAGLRSQELNGYYLTEDQGLTIRVFPISQRLRYLVPFHQVDEVLGHLANDYPPGSLAVLADDGEKFGIWPGTYQHVYEHGWLERFLEALEANRHRLEMITFSQALLAAEPRGRIYLPTASYTEMGEWVLEPEAEADYRQLVDRLKQEGSYERCRPFIRGGLWKNFLVKYPEANFLYRKMLQVSQWAERAGPEARRELYRGQCNCGYWHGIFGGLYLPHLRTALYRQLIKAERLCPDEGRAPTAQSDFDGDGRDEVLLTSPWTNLYLKPDWGGAIYEWDLKDKEVNLTDNLSRRPESYHRRIAQFDGGQDLSGRSIHEMMAAKEPGLERWLAYDPCPRLALADHLLPGSAQVMDLQQSALPAYQGVLHTRWRMGRLGPGAEAEFLGCYRDMEIEKNVLLEGRRLTVGYRWTNQGQESLELRPGVEFNFGLLAAGQGRFLLSSEGDPLLLALDRPAAVGPRSRVAVHDDFRGIVIVFSLSQPWDLWCYPVETVSQSESGLERNYQCSCLVWSQPLRWDPGQSHSLTLEIEVEG